MSKHVIAQGPTIDAALIEKFRNSPVDVPDVLQLLLFNWALVESSLEDDTELRSALEGQLAKTADKFLNYEEMQHVIGVVSEALARFHEDLKLQLGPLFEKYGLTHDVRVTRLLDRDIVIRLDEVCEEYK